jgi:hypothetical protein
VTLRMIDTFSGIGGFSLAARWLGGIETVQFVEREPYCQRILSKHFPGVPVHDDICTFQPQPGSADIVCGGFPCQDISQAGAGAGIREGTRLRACSTNSCVSFAWWDRDSWSWRTSQRSLIEGWTSFSENWPKQGLMRNGHVFRRVLWAPATAGTAGGLLPTPVAQTSQGGPSGLNGGAGARQMLADAGFPRCTGAPTALPIGPDGTPGLPTPSACIANDGERPETWLARRERVKLTANNGNGMGMPLTIAAQLLPTPTVNDAATAPSLPRSEGGTACLARCSATTQCRLDRVRISTRHSSRR